MSSGETSRFLSSATRCLGGRNRLTEFNLHLPQFHAVKRHACQPFERIPLLLRDSARHRVGDSQRSQGKAAGIAQRNAGIEADMVRSRYHGAAREALIARCVLNDHYALLLQGMVTKAYGTGNFLQINSNTGLEPMARRFGRAEKGYRRIEQVRQQFGDVIKCRFRRRP
jgi:hypothetical protein